MKSASLVRRIAATAILAAAGCGEEGGTVQANRPPTLDVQASYTGREGELLAFNLNVADPDENDVVEVVMNAANLPEGHGATFDPATRAFRWTPDYKSGRADPYVVTFKADDKKDPVEKSVAIVIQDVNRKPRMQFTPSALITKNEGERVTFTVSALDDDEEDTVTVFWENQFAGASFDGATFTWTPGFHAAGNYVLSFRAQDNHLPVAESSTEAVTLNVLDVNQRPYFTSAPVTRVFYEGETASFRVQAEDSDEGQTVTVVMTDLSNPPTLATTQPDGTFTWAIPQGTHGTFNFKFTATDNGTPALSAERTESLRVKLTNLPPVMEEIGNRTVAEGATLEFTVLGQVADPSEADAASEALVQTLTYSMQSIGGQALPAAATLDPLTGAFKWNVACTAAGTYQVRFKVTDDGVPSREKAQDMTITVTPANCAPAFTAVTRLEDGTTEAAQPGTILYAVDENSPITLQVRAVDPDGDNITYGVSGALPPGAVFNAASRTFSWKPSCTASSASPYTVVFTATDGIVGAPSQQTVRIDVSNINCAPVITSLCNTALTNPTDTSNVVCNAMEGAQVSFTATAQDGDSDNLTFSMGPANPKIPGAAFNPATRVFSWKPGCNDAGSYNATFNVFDGTATTSRTVTFVVAPGSCRPEFRLITVDQAGVLSQITLADADAETTITLQENKANAITVRADTSENGLTVSYGASGLPPGATFSQNNSEGTATLTWNTRCTDKGNYTVRLTAIDDNAVADLFTLKITVTETNCAPVFAALAPRTVAEGQTLTMSLAAAASDPDNDALTDFTLTWLKDGSATAAPSSAAGALDRLTGQFSWTPGYADAGEWAIVVTVNDRSPLGPAGSNTAAVTVPITVTNTPRPPQFTQLIITPAGGSSTTVPVASGDTSKSVMIDENVTTAIKLVATSPDGFAIDYGASNLPAGAVLASDTLTWKPSCTQKGSYPVALLATDESGRDTLTLDLIVNETNCAPTWAAVPPQVVAEQRTLNVALGSYASDPDGDTLTDFSVTWKKGSTDISQPATATFDPRTGALSWTPAPGENGSYTLTIAARDRSAIAPQDLSAQTTVAITVTKTNQPPVFTQMTVTRNGTADPSVSIAPDNTSQSVTLEEASIDQIKLKAVSPEGLAVNYSATGLPPGATFQVDAIDASGSIVWSPGCTQAGTYTMRVLASDANGFDTLDVVITVNATNCPPSFAEIGARTVAEGQTLALDLRTFVTDPDGDPQSGWVFTDSWLKGTTPVARPGTASLSASGLFSWTPGYDESGAYTVTFAVNDGSALGPSGSHTNQSVMTVTVTDTNRPPSLSFNPPGGGAGDTYAVNEAGTLAFDVVGIDPDNDTLSYSMAFQNGGGSPISVPPGVSFNAQTGAFSWTPDYVAAGSYRVVFTADDGKPNGRTSKTAFVTVQDKDDPPTIALSPNVTSVDTPAGVNIAYAVTGRDTDGDQVSLAAHAKNEACAGTGAFGALPSGASFTQTSGANLASGTFSWTPTTAAAGNWCIRFTAADGTGSDAASATVEIVVRDTAPTINVSPSVTSLTINEGETINFAVTGRDIDGDTVSLAANGGATCGAAGLPAGASWTTDPGVNFASGAFSWTPSYTQAGTYCIRFTASDGAGKNSVTHTINLAVNDFDACGGIYCPFGETCRDGACQVVFCSANSQCIYPETCNSGRCYLGHYLGRLPAPESISQTALSAYYAFEGNAQDGSANGLHGTVHGAVPTDGYVRGGYSFSNPADRVEVASSAAFNPGTGGFTVAAWIKASASDTPGARRIATHRDPATSSWWSLMLDAAGNLSFETSSTNVLTYTRDLRDGQWHHVVFVRDSSLHMRLYLDGVRVAEAPDSGFNPDNNGPLQIGDYFPSGSSAQDPFQGVIDEVRIWKRALAESEIAMFFGGQGTFRAGAAYAVNATRTCGSGSGPGCPHSAYLALTLGPVGNSASDGTTCSAACGDGYVCVAGACVSATPRSNDHILLPGASEAQHTP